VRIKLCSAFESTLKSAIVSYRIVSYAKVVDSFVDRCLWQVLPDLQPIGMGLPYGRMLDMA